MATKKSNAFTQPELDALDTAVSETLTTMLLAEAQLTGILEGTPDDALRSEMVSRVLRLRADIDLLNAKYDRFLNNKVGMAPPSESLVAAAVGFSQALADVQHAQNRAEALLALSAKALDAADKIRSA
jgi:hypothetical protein